MIMHKIEVSTPLPWNHLDYLKLLVTFISVGIENYLNGEVIHLLEKLYLKITTLKLM